jgi:bifunctional non-homologous end joining protein LigD
MNALSEDWTDPRGSRPFFGSLLLGVYDKDQVLQYVGQAGAGVHRRGAGTRVETAARAENETLPVCDGPAPRPAPPLGETELVVDVRFTGWTKGREAASSLYEGLRTDAKRERAHQEHRSIAAEAAR